MFDIDLRDFFRSGRFGPIHLGMTKHEVESLFGKPQDWGGTFPWWLEEKLLQARKFTLPYSAYPIWKYDEMEFFFGDERERLYQIFCDHLGKLKGAGKAFYLEKWLFQSGESLVYQKLERGLLEEGIAFKHTRDKLCGELILGSGVIIAYEYNDDTVNAISHSNAAFLDAP